MKKWIPLIIVLVTFIAAGGKFLAAKKYGALCLSQGYELLTSSPEYFNAISSIVPGLY
jgi:hypothetical protein